MPFRHTNSAILIFVAMIALAASVQAATVAYWRFEEGPAGAAVYKPFGALDSSGYGNHLDPGTLAGSGGYWFHGNRAYGLVPSTGAINTLSVKNSGSSPSLQTRSQTLPEGPGSYPSILDIEAIMPSQFTIEAFFKPEEGGYRTIVGRDGYNVASHDPKLAALYFQVRPDNSVAVCFADVAGYWHVAASPAGMVKGFSFASDPEGTTGRWYYMAAVSNGSVLSLYLANVSAGTSPMLVAQTDIAASGSPSRSLARGTASGADWHAGGWSVGRGLYNGVHTDRAYGFIDEVRISNMALSVNQFLMNPKPTVDRNPLFNAADPHVLLVDGTAWIFPTSGYYRYFYAYSSQDMVNWQSRGVILNFDNIPWIPAGKSAWAPCMIKKNNMYYFYYSVGPKPSHIGVAYGTSIFNLVDKGSALLSDNGVSTFEAIDPMVFTDPVSGKSYLYAGGSAGSRVRVFELNADMISFAREITVNNPSYFTEGVFMHYRNGVYYLSYSNGSWRDSTYCVRYSTSTTPYGPWTYRGKILSSEGWFKGPGHHSFMYNPAMDEWYIVYHRWNNRLDNGPYTTGSRSVAVEKITYQNNLIKEIMQTDTGVGPVWLGQWLQSDFNHDDSVDTLDLLALADAWRTASTQADIAPVGRDGIVNLKDLAFFSSQWLKSPEPW